MADAVFDEFVSAYLAEVEEHLGSANTHLMSIEGSLRKGEANLRGVREVFRALHTIKGLSAMVGVESVVTLAHHMEALLRSADRASAKLPAAAVDVLIRGIQAIESQVRAFGEGKAVAPPSPELLARIDAFDVDSGLAGPDTRPVLELSQDIASKLGALELDQLHRGLALGKSVLRVDFEPSTEKAARGTTINSVRAKIEQLAEIVKIVPMATASTSSTAGLAFAILVLADGETLELDPDADLAISLVATSPKVLDVASSEASLEPEAPLEPEALPEVRQHAHVRVDVTRLDDAVERLSALIVTRFRMNRAIAKLAALGVDTRELTQIQSENGRQLRDLRGAIFRVRMVPIAELLERIPLLVRGLRRAVNRLVRVELDAGNTEVDKAVAERLFPALVHLIRNAVDHAIESPDERIRRGKPEEGLLRISCTARSNTWLELRISDDGRGIDTAAVARRARLAAPSSPAALLEMLCTPGLSTREVATATSGRGMGMEIVKRTVEQLGGSMSLETEQGTGTTFVLRVPLSLSIVDAFSFECAGERFVVPVASIEEIVEIDDSLLVQAPRAARSELGLAMLERRGQVVPLLPLSKVLRIERQGSNRRALIVKRGTESLAFGVDRMLGQQEVVVRPLEDSLLRVRGIAGATDLGDGKPTLVLDLLGLGAGFDRITLGSQS
jgi:two-component system, chemotaxis family, sensor kinase CheA